MIFLPPLIPEENRTFVRLSTEFGDYRHWQGLLQKHLKRYAEPEPEQACTLASMERWLDRLNMSETRYQEWSGCTVEEFMQLNPTWPLFAWLGTVLEQVDEDRTH